MNPLNVLRALLAELVEWFNETFERVPGPTSHVPQHRKSRDGKRPSCLHCQTAALMRELQPTVQPAQPALTVVQPEPGLEPEQEPEPESPTAPAMEPVQPQEPALFEFRCGNGTGAIDWPTGTFRLRLVRAPQPLYTEEYQETHGLGVPEFYRRHRQAQEPALLALESLAVAS